MLGLHAEVLRHRWLAGSLGLLAVEVAVKVADLRRVLSEPFQIGNREGALQCYDVLIGPIRADLAECGTIEQSAETLIRQAKVSRGCQSAPSQELLDSKVEVHARIKVTTPVTYLCHAQGSASRGLRVVH